MNEFSFSVPQNITVGKGSLAKLPEIAKKSGGSHAFLMSGPHLAKMGLVEKAANSLKSAGISVDTFTDIEGNPSVETVDKATAAFKEAGADFIVAFGGGSQKQSVLLQNMAEALQNMKVPTKFRDRSFR